MMSMEFKDEKKKIEEMKVEFEPLTKLMKEVLGDKVEKVLVSSRALDQAYECFVGHVSSARSMCGC